MLVFVLAFALVPGLGTASEHEDTGAPAVAVYFLMDELDADGPFLVPVHRDTADTVAVAEAAVTALLVGPTDAEAAALPALGSEIPDGVTLHAITIDDGLATVDVSGEFAEGGGSATMLARLAQLVFTLTQFSTVDGVALELDGEPTTVFSGEGLDVTPPVDRGYFDGSGVLPDVFVDAPVYEGAFDAEVSGTTTIESFTLEVYDGDGRLLGDAEAALDVEGRTAFSWVVPYVSLTEQFGVVMASWDTDEGQKVREYPVTLAPTPVPDARGIDAACSPVEVPEAGFADVADGNVHAEAIGCAAWREITRGRTETTYEPADDVTRGQMAGMLARTLTAVGEELPAQPASTFTDVAGTTHELEIEQLADLGILVGVDGDTFEPDAPVDRAQMTTLLVQTFEYVAGFELEATGDYYADDDTNVHAASINAASLAGLTSGVADGRFEPDADVRRDQMASFVSRLLDLMVVEGAALIAE